MRAFYVDGAAVRETSRYDEVRQRYEAGHVVWVDVRGRNAEIERLLVEVFKVHELTLEDVWSKRTIPKIEDFDDYLFILLHGIRPHDGPAGFDVVEIDCILGKNFLITHHGKHVDAVDEVERDCLKTSKLLARGPAWVMHDLMDHIVDGYLPLLDRFDEEIGGLEAEVLELTASPRGRGLMGEALRFKRMLMALRRISIYQREIFLRLSRHEFEEIPSEAAPFFRDVYDHYARITDLADSYRELVGATLEVFLNVQSNRMNEVMKTLTLMSTVMLPLTFIAGVYGMNFERMPELRWSLGYPFALTLMAGTALAIVLWFRRRGWL